MKLVEQLTPAYGEINIFDKYSIWLEDFFSVMGCFVDAPIPLPLIGAEYALNGNTVMIKRKNIHQPTIYGSSKVLSSVKEPFTFRLDVYNTLINNGNRMFAVIGKNYAFSALLDAFTSRGGTFFILSPSGYYEHCVLKEFGAYNQKPEQISQRMYLDFEWIPVIDAKGSKNLSNAIKGSTGV